MKKVSLIVGALLIASSAYAQPTPPECKDFPNGGKVSINIPVITGPPTCQACGAGFSVPSGFVLRFSNDHHDTCELKKPDGSNSGYCRADTTCPTGTTRTYLNNTLWVCQSGGGKKEITCPAPPKVPATTPTAPPAVTSCIERLKQAEGQLTTSAKGFVAAAGNSAKGPGAATPGSIGGASVQAGTMLGVAMTYYTTTMIPIALRKKAACDNVDTNNGTAMADCRAATSDLGAAREREKGFVYKYKDARAIAKREIVEATTVNPELKNAGSGLTTAIDNAGQALDSCVAAIAGITP